MTANPTPDNPADENHDLSQERYDADTAAFGDRDLSNQLNHRIRVPRGRAVAGTEDKVFEWSKFQYVTDETDEREERKGDLHGGQLHRENRAAERVLLGLPLVEQKPERKNNRKRGGKGEQDGNVAIQIAKKPTGEKMPPLAKGVPKEITRDEAKEWFWNEKIL